MKLTGCTSISLVSHVYMSAAHCEQYRILFHIKMRDIVQKKVDRSILGFTFNWDIIHNSNILINTITPTRSTLKINVIDGSHSDIPLCCCYMNINDPLQQHVCGITHYSVHELHL